MTARRDLLLLFASALVFGVCCVAMLIAHEELSIYPAVTYGFVAIWGVSALVWPVYLVRVLSDAVRIALNRLLSR